VVAFLLHELLRTRRFYSHHTTMYHAAPRPSGAETVDDPLLWLVAKTRCGRPRMRIRGVYAADEEDEHEPGRTERLLTRPLRLWRARRSVAELAGLWFWLDPSGAGLGVYYRFVALAMQCVVAMIVGMGTLMQPGSLAAHAQVWIILLIQAVMFALCIFTSFASDRLDAAFTGLEVAMQATAVLLLYGYNLATEDGTATPAANASMDGLPHRVEDGTREQIESTALILSLSAAYLQLLLCVYDSFFLALIAACQREDSVTKVIIEMAMNAVQSVQGFLFEGAKTTSGLVEMLKEACGSFDCCAACKRIDGTEARAAAPTTSGDQQAAAPDDQEAASPPGDVSKANGMPNEDAGIDALAARLAAQAIDAALQPDEALDEAQLDGTCAAVAAAPSSTSPTETPAVEIGGDRVAIGGDRVEIGGDRPGSGPPAAEIGKYAAPAGVRRAWTKEPAEARSGRPWKQSEAISSHLAREPAELAAEARSERAKLRVSLTSEGHGSNQRQSRANSLASEDSPAVLLPLGSGTEWEGCLTLRLVPPCSAADGILPSRAPCTVGGRQEHAKCSERYDTREDAQEDVCEDDTGREGRQHVPASRGPDAWPEDGLRAPRREASRAALSVHTREGGPRLTAAMPQVAGLSPASRPACAPPLVRGVRLKAVVRLSSPSKQMNLVTSPSWRDPPV